MDKDKEVFINTDEIAEYLFKNLVDRGYLPKDEELEEIADIMFEFLLEKCIIEDEDVE